jgi:hypothetical protein
MEWVEEYIRAKKATDPLTNQSNFNTQTMTKDYGFTRLNRSLRNINLPPESGPIPADLSPLIQVE